MRLTDEILEMYEKEAAAIVNATTSGIWEPTAIQAARVLRLVEAHRSLLDTTETMHDRLILVDEETRNIYDANVYEEELSVKLERRHLRRIFGDESG